MYQFAGDKLLSRLISEGLIVPRSLAEQNLHSRETPVQPKLCGFAINHDQHIMRSLGGRLPGTLLRVHVPGEV